MHKQLLTFRSASIAAIAGLALWSSVLVAQPASAATNNAAQVYQEGRSYEGDRTITGSSFELRSGDRMNGDLTVLGGEVTLAEGTRPEL